MKWRSCKISRAQLEYQHVKISDQNPECNRMPFRHQIMVMQTEWWSFAAAALPVLPVFVALPLGSMHWKTM